MWPVGCNILWPVATTKKRGRRTRIERNQQQREREGEGEGACAIAATISGGRNEGRKRFLSEAREGRGRSIPLPRPIWGLKNCRPADGLSQLFFPLVPLLLFFYLSSLLPPPPKKKWGLLVMKRWRDAVLNSAQTLKSSPPQCEILCRS